MRSMTRVLLLLYLCCGCASYYSACPIPVLAATGDITLSCSTANNTLVEMNTQPWINWSYTVEDGNGLIIKRTLVRITPTNTTVLTLLPENVNEEVDETNIHGVVQIRMENYTTPTWVAYQLTITAVIVPIPYQEVSNSHMINLTIGNAAPRIILLNHDPQIWLARYDRQIMNWSVIDFTVGATPTIHIQLITDDGVIDVPDALITVPLGVWNNAVISVDFTSLNLTIDTYTVRFIADDGLGFTTFHESTMIITEISITTMIVIIIPFVVLIGLLVWITRKKQKKVICAPGDDECLKRQQSRQKTAAPVPPADAVHSKR